MRIMQDLEKKLLCYVFRVNAYIISKTLLSLGFISQKWWYLVGTYLLLPVQNLVIMETSGTLPVPMKCK